MKKMKMNKTSLKVSILNKYKNFRFSDKKLIKNILKIILDNPSVVDKIKFSFENIKKISLDFVFCSDEYIKEINSKYRNIDKSTDVITFALYADSDDCLIFDDEISLGEIIISVETAKRQAKGSFNDELCTLISHGILHLLGFDHQNEMDYNFVVDIQKKVLRDLYNAKV